MNVRNSVLNHFEVAETKIIPEGRSYFDFCSLITKEGSYRIFFLNSLVAALNSHVEFSKLYESWDCEKNRVARVPCSSLEIADWAGCPDPA